MAWSYKWSKHLCSFLGFAFPPQLNTEVAGQLVCHVESKRLLAARESHQRLARDACCLLKRCKTLAALTNRFA